MMTLSTYTSPQEQELFSFPMGNKNNYRSNLPTLPPIQENSDDMTKTALNDEKSQLSSRSISTDDTATSTPSLFDVHLSFHKDSIPVGSIYPTSQEETLPGKSREKTEGSTNFNGGSDESSDTQLFKQSLERKEGYIDLNATSDNMKCTKLTEQAYGLLRTSMGVYLPSTPPAELFPGAILGRTIVSRKSGKKRLPRNLKDLRRVDIGIGYKCQQGKYDDGISRNQIEVLKIDDDGILIKVCERVRNPIAVRSHGYYHRQYGPGAIKYLQEGDELIFDAYMKRPKHIFKIVSFATSNTNE